MKLPLNDCFTKKLDYKSLQVFGCACWPILRPYNKHKLQFRSQRCVFLGFSNFYKGFKCLDPASGRVYISRDVIFDETIIPFSELHPNVSRRLQDEISLLPNNLLNPGVLQLHERVPNFSTNSANNLGTSASFQEEEQAANNEVRSGTTVKADSRARSPAIQATPRSP
jgi:hypothetical protein